MNYNFFQHFYLYHSKFGTILFIYAKYFETSHVRGFLVFSDPNIKYLAFGTLNANALILRSWSRVPHSPLKVTMAFEQSYGVLLCQNHFPSPLYVCVCFSKKKKKKKRKKNSLGLERIMHKSIKLSNGLLAQLTPLNGLKMLPRPQFSNAHSLNYLIKKIIYIYIYVCERERERERER